MREQRYRRAGASRRDVQRRGVRARSAPQRGVRAWAYTLSATSAVVVAFWGALAHHGTSPGLDESAALAMPVGTPTEPTTVISAPPPPPVSASPVPSAYSFRYTFDEGVDNLDAAGGPPLTTLTANGGVLRTVSHGGGHAIGFPARCDDPGTSGCSRAILESEGDASPLNPGNRPIRYGADIRIGADETSDGENVVQKGFATGGSEYKLQVDGDAGRPSCAVVGIAAPTIYLAMSSTSIADGRWHRVACDLESGVLTVTVDGAVSGHASVPSSTTISNDDELRIGGKGKSPNNDQFNGELDNVWVTVGP